MSSAGKGGHGRGGGGGTRRGDEITTPTHRSLYELVQDPGFSKYLEEIMRRVEGILGPQGALASFESRLRHTDELVEETREALAEMRTMLSAVLATSELSLRTVTKADETRVLVLVVEDEAIMQSALERVLRQAGMHSLSAANPSEAVKWLTSASVDVAVLDIRLRDSHMTGLDLATFIQREYPDVGIVIMTGLLGRSDALAAKALGVRVLEKPFSNADFIAAIREAHARPPTSPPPHAAQ